MTDSQTIARNLRRFHLLTPMSHVSRDRAECDCGDTLVMRRVLTPGVVANSIAPSAVRVGSRRLSFTTRADITQQMPAASVGPCAPCDGRHVVDLCVGPSCLPWVEHSNSRFESIGFDSLCESIRIDSFCKKSAFRITSCHAVFALNKQHKHLKCSDFKLKYTIHAIESYTV